jgi:hypothetical protein
MMTDILYIETELSDTKRTELYILWLLFPGTSCEQNLKIELSIK